VHGNKQVMTMKNKTSNNSTITIIALSLLFLGFSPINEPHLFGKVTWLLGGAVGMKPIDWFDLIMHGGSLIISIILFVKIIFLSINKK
jgi:phosphoglycerol transferase MdoB-like AlkP superfamily enzyme